MKKYVTLRNALYAAPFTLVAASAQTTGGTGGFDTSNLESTATAVLAVGAAITIGFTVFKIGKRAMNKV